MRPFFRPSFPRGALEFRWRLVVLSFCVQTVYMVFWRYNWFYRFIACFVTFSGQKWSNFWWQWCNEVVYAMLWFVVPARPTWCSWSLVHLLNVFLGTARHRPWKVTDPKRRFAFQAAFFRAKLLNLSVDRSLMILMPVLRCAPHVHPFFHSNPILRWGLDG